MKERTVADRTAVVTGAASGMGRAVVRIMADEGARVFAIDRNADALAEVFESHDSVTGTAVDLSDRDAIMGLPALVESAVGPADILVNNAGMSRMSFLEQDDFVDAWDEVIEVNLTSYALMARAFLAHLERERSGRIVNTASTEGLMATKGNNAYAVSKHGVIGLTRALAVELGPRGVTVNAVCPGPINTGMTAFIPDDAKQTFARRRVPLRRYGEPAEVAHVIVAICMPACSYLNGAIIPVDGGQTAKAT